MTIRPVSKVILSNLASQGKGARTSTSPHNAEDKLPKRWLSRALNVRYVDAGGGQDCANELNLAFGPDYDLERLGVRLVASPRHADLLLVAGCVTTKMASPLEMTYNAIAKPKLVVAFGDSAITGGPFLEAKHCFGAVESVIPVDFSIPGDPPSAAEVVDFFYQLTGRIPK
ncbi:MAG: oxidoreductase [Actinomycetota bacterium]|nr:oxidoreductase [Actinomycetota bacterium]